MKTDSTVTGSRGSNPRFSAINFISRGRAVRSARRAHNPEVIGSNPFPATKWSCGVAVNMSPCHGEDRGFDPRQDRHLAR